MADKLIIALVNANPENLVEVALPLLQATAAASMEYEVEVIFSGRTGKLAIKGYAERVVSNTANDTRTLMDYIQEAYEAGVVLKVCTPSLELWGEDTIAQIHEIVGSTYLISEAMDSDTVTFTY